MKEKLVAKKEGEEVREGEKDMQPADKKTVAKKGKSKKDTEIIPGPEGSEGVTKMNDPRKKGAPSLDDENADACGKKMDKKGGKSCGCQHKNDALTPQEYLKACDMGIQGRSRIYIRARLDMAERLDGPMAEKKAEKKAKMRDTKMKLKRGKQKAEEVKEKMPPRGDGGSWAKGFSMKDAESAMTANSMNLATDKYSDEKRKLHAQGQPRNYIQARTFNT